VKTSTIEVIDDYELIRKQNDQARRESAHLLMKKSIPCRVLFSAELQQLRLEHLMHIRLLVANQNMLQNPQDIYSEHDFGLLKYGTEQVIWTFDYISKETGFSAEDPGDLQDTIRLLSIMFDYEY